MAVLVMPVHASQGVPGQPIVSIAFEAESAGEAVATIGASCPRCEWGVPGREAVVLKLEVDGEYSQHLLLTRGGSASYRVMLGPVGTGEHRLDVSLDAAQSARDAGSFAVGDAVVQVVLPEAPGYEKLAFAPILHPRPDTIGRFSDVPLLAWVETDSTPAGRRFRYSVIFSNEDGGTPADQLMATWGRTTDIEMVYDVAIDAAGNILKEDIQAENHESRAFHGQKVGRHPLLWVATDNNMVSDQGTIAVRHAPAPIPFDLNDKAREAVMDANPWTYAVMAAELWREGKIDAGARPGTGIVPDPRRYAYLEACGELSESTAIAFDIGIERGGRVEWFSTDREMPRFRIARSGCFRAAAPLPEGVGLTSMPPPRVRVRAHRRVRDRDTPPSAAPVSATLRRVNAVFMLRGNYRPGGSVFKWTGRVSVGPERSVEITTLR